jgi:hypothetical protein
LGASTTGDSLGTKNKNLSAVLLTLTIELRRRPPTRRPASIQGSNAARSLLAFFVERSIVGHSVESERNRSDVPRHDIAAQVADGRLEAKPSRVLSYKDIREAHHILEAAEAGKEW